MKPVQRSVQKSGDIADALLVHYDMHARTLPWRMPPSRFLTACDFPDPYRVWLSEIMLQQTTVAAVIPYFERFTARWPDFMALAGADDADVMAAWAGLGYYARARNLLKCARVVASAHGGRLPGTEAKLLQLPGIGPYTAAAIAAIAFGERAVVVDANVERVVSRLFAIDTPLPAARPQIYTAANSITPDVRSGDFAQAMMDLGAGYCSVRTPSCTLCPVLKHCDAHEGGLPETYPVKLPKKPKPVRLGMAYWAECGGQVLLIERPGTGMLAGMRALPSDNWAARRDGDSAPPFEANWRILDTVILHSFTHFTLHMKVAVAEGPPQTNLGAYWPVNLLDKAGLPTLFSKAAAIVFADQQVSDKKRIEGE